MNIKQGYLYIDLSTVPDNMAEYVQLIENETTNKICKCEWLVHPDDEGKPEGQRRMRRGEQSLECPVHTKEGFLLGFLNWLLTQAGKPAIDLTKYTDTYQPPEDPVIPGSSGGICPHCTLIHPLWIFGCEQTRKYYEETSKLND